MTCHTIHRIYLRPIVTIRRTSIDDNMIPAFTSLENLITAHNHMSLQFVVKYSWFCRQWSRIFSKKMTFLNPTFNTARQHAHIRQPHVAQSPPETTRQEEPRIIHNDLGVASNTIRLKGMSQLLHIWQWMTTAMLSQRTC